MSHYTIEAATVIQVRWRLRQSRRLCTIIMREVALRHRLTSRVQALARGHITRTCLAPVRGVACATELSLRIIIGAAAFTYFVYDRDSRMRVSPEALANYQTRTAGASRPEKVTTERTAGSRRKATSAKKQRAKTASEAKARARAANAPQKAADEGRMAIIELDGHLSLPRHTGHPGGEDQHPHAWRHPRGPHQPRACWRRRHGP